MTKLKSEKLFVIRAYCSTCKKLLMESVSLTKKELMSSWDKAVFDAPGIQCKDCGHNIPNFNINLKIYNKGSKIEYRPEQILPKPIAPMKDVNDMLGIKK